MYYFDVSKKALNKYSNYVKLYGDYKYDTEKKSISKIQRVRSFSLLEKVKDRVNNVTAILKSMNKHIMGDQTGQHLRIAFIHS